VLRLLEGVEAKGHLHKTYDEILYIIKGNGQTTIGDKTIDVKPGTIHLSPMGKAHATKKLATSH